MVGTIVDTATQAKRIKRPNFSTEFKRQVVEATLQPDASAALIGDTDPVWLGAIVACVI
jgi:transposase